MQIDVTKLLTNQITTLHFNGSVTLPKELLENTLIDNLKDISTKGSITTNIDNELVVTGQIIGTMILKDDITLAPVEYNFATDFEEHLNHNEKILDITDILWQNILVEIPSKVRSTDEAKYPSGDGWRVISEETYDKERNNTNNPFANLNELLKTKEDK